MITRFGGEWGTAVFAAVPKLAFWEPGCHRQQKEARQGTAIGQQQVEQLAYSQKTGGRFKQRRVSVLAGWPGKSLFNLPAPTLTSWPMWPERLLVKLLPWNDDGVVAWG
jgi:hypothetical protein